MTIRVGDRVRILTPPWLDRTGTVLEINKGPMGYEVAIDTFQHGKPVPFDRDELAYTSLAGDTSAAGQA